MSESLVTKLIVRNSWRDKFHWGFPGRSMEYGESVLDTLAHLFPRDHRPRNEIIKGVGRCAADTLNR